MNKASKTALHTWHYRASRNASRKWLFL